MIVFALSVPVPVELSDNLFVACSKSFKLSGSIKSALAYVSIGRRNILYYATLTSNRWKQRHTDGMSKNRFLILLYDIYFVRKQSGHVARCRPDAAMGIRS